MTNEEWIRQIEAGDREAFRAAYEKYGKQIYRRVLNETGDKEQAQQILKNIFRSLLHQLQESDSDPILFMLEGLTDLQLSAFRQSAAPAAPAPVPQPGSEPTPAPQPEPEGKPEPIPQPEPEGKPEPRAVSSEATPIERAENDYPGEYEPLGAAAVQLDKTALPETAVPAKKRRPVLTAFLVLILVILVLLTVWLGAGVLMTYSIIPKYDLGYSWFNSTVFPLFRF